MATVFRRHPHLVQVCDRGLLVRQTRPRQATWFTIHFGNQGEVSRGGGTAREPRAPICIGALALVGICTTEGVGRIVKGAQAQIAIELPLLGRETSDGYRALLQISVLGLTPKFSCEGLS